MSGRSKFKKKVRFRRLLAIITIISMLTGILPILPAYADVNPEPNAQTQVNGTLIIYVHNGSEWEELGSLPFDKFLQEKQVGLGNLAPTGEQVRVKLVKNGGGAAHLDSVLLGGTAPIAVNGEEGHLLAKLSRQDLDLINAGENGVELTFDKNGQDMALAVTARIEGTNISKTPFQFPRENMYKVMDENSAFYTYSLNSGGKSLALGDMLDAVDGQEPFYREYVVPGSGHPPGDIYGWVMNDGQNLYVAQEFTPDNTMDGDKDYAKVYVLTENGLKEFKVTASEETWGKAYFTYTDKVNYQHKFYEFIIPLSEIGINEGDTGDIQIAFGAYGTMAPTMPEKRYPALAYNPQANNYLCVYSYVDPDTGWWTEKIMGELVAADGTVIAGSQFTINDYDDCYNQKHPAVAYDSVNNRYLVVWTRYTSSGYKLYGQLVNADGTLQGDVMWLSDSESSQNPTPAVAYDSINRKFLVTWDHKDTAPPYHWHIYGRFVNADTGDYGAEFAISDSIDNSHDIQRPATAFDSQNGRFLVVWDDNRQNLGVVNPDIYGQFVEFADPKLIGSNFEVAAASNSQAYPSVAYDSENHKYMVVWEDYRNLDTSNEDIYGCILDADDTSTIAELEVSEDGLTSEDDFPQWRPTVVYGNNNTGFWVAWKHVNLDGDGNWSDGDPGLRGRFVAADGGMSDTLYSNPGPAYDNTKPAAAFNSTDLSFLNAFESFEDDGLDEPIDTAYWLIETSSSPQVLSTVPANNATGVARDTAITINFSEEMTRSANFNDITIMAGSTAVDYDYDGVGSATLTLAPKEPLTYGTAYTVTIPADAVKNTEDNGLASPYSFGFTVQAAPASGSPGWSSPVDNTPPAAPLKLRLVSSSPVISLAWDKSTEPDLGGYNIYRKEKDAESFIKLNSSLLTSEAYQDKTAKDGITYIYHVTALDKTGNESGKSNEVEASLAAKFTDVPSDSWCNSSAATLTLMDVIHGYPDGTFRPNKSITRAEFAKMLVLAMGWELEATATPSFPDLADDHWALQYIETGVARGVLHGYKDGFFRPDKNISRAEIAKIIALAINPPAGTSTFTDTASHWARDHINSCAKEEIVNGYPDNTFRPNNPATRCEAAKMIDEAINKMK